MTSGVGCTVGKCSNNRSLVVADICMVQLLRSGQIKKKNVHKLKMFSLLVSQQRSHSTEEVSARHCICALWQQVLVVVLKGSRCIECWPSFLKLQKMGWILWGIVEVLSAFLPGW